MAAPLPEEHAPSPAPAMRIAYPAGLDPFNRSVSAYLAEHYPPNSHDDLATCAMFAFEVAVSGSLDVRLDAHEHDAYVWATEEEIRSGRVPGVEGDLQLTFGATRELIYDGFRRRREEPAETPSRVVERDGAVL
ncbi:Endopolygalacturonase 1 [Verticillium dahliae VDG1]|nr:Endopolygalacturonase 1 [Verticillium dahliae VDG1]